MPILTKDKLILDSLKEYYKNNEEIYIELINIINKKSNISISLIEHFVLTYAKRKNTMYCKSDNSFFIVYLNYKNFLKGYGKKYTDPFRRKREKNEKDFYIELHGIKIRTRIAQLNFFKWAFENELIEYVNNNYKKIEEDLVEYKKKKSMGKKKDIYTGPSVSEYKIKEINIF